MTQTLNLIKLVCRKLLSQNIKNDIRQIDFLYDWKDNGEEIPKLKF